MEHSSAAARLARDYLGNAANRGIHQRDAALSRRAGSHAADRAAAIDYLLSGRYRREAVEELEELVGHYRSRALRAIERILDAGCGPGITTMALADHFPAASVVGLDVEAPALALARHLTSNEDRCSFEQVALEHYEPSEGFDLIQCRSVIEHVFAPEAALRNVIRMLRPGGVAYVETPNYLFPWEPHVKLPMLPKSPKSLLRAQCRLFGRDQDFVDHLNFACDPIRLRRWVTEADPSLVIVDLMACKARDIFRERSSVPRVRSRARITAVVNRSQVAARLAEWAFTRLPVAPSVLLLIIKPAQTIS